MHEHLIVAWRFGPNLEVAVRQNYDDLMAAYQKAKTFWGAVMGLAVILVIVGAVLGYWPWWIILCVVGAYIAFAMALGRHYASKTKRTKEV